MLVQAGSVASVEAADSSIHLAPHSGAQDCAVFWKNPKKGSKPTTSSEPSSFLTVSFLA